MAAVDPTAADWALLLRSLEESRQLGFLGSRPIDEVVVHARHFVTALRGYDTSDGSPFDGPLLDLGSGGGVPGLVIAHDLPASRITMLDRRRTRTDFLSRVVRRMEWSDRVDVLTQDASRPSSSQRGHYQAAVARGFGPPVDTLTIAAAWTCTGGLIVISEPPTGDRWEGVDTSAIGVDRVPSESQVAVFRKR